MDGRIPSMILPKVSAGEPSVLRQTTYAALDLILISGVSPCFLPYNDIWGAYFP
jgi:hypothetical protein